MHLALTRGNSAGQAPNRLEQVVMSLGLFLGGRPGWRLSEVCFRLEILADLLWQCDVSKA